MRIGQLCELFDAAFMAKAIGQTPVTTEVPTTYDADLCRYYPASTKSGPYILLTHNDHLSVANQKKGHEVLDRTIETNDSINMEHFIVKQEDGLINSIYLVLGDMAYISINRTSAKALSETGMVELAATLAERLSSGDFTTTGSQSSGSTGNNWSSMSLGEVEKESEVLTVIRFWDLIADGDVSSAVAMLDVDAPTKQMWAANFATLESLEIDRVSPVVLDEWTDTRQIFKATLEVKAGEAGEQMGWFDGSNARWVTLQKSGNTWLVHELANNP